jgi:hypothetical protein
VTIGQPLQAVETAAPGREGAAQNAAAMALPAGRVARASRQDAGAIEALRLACYRGAREFELLQPECLSWDERDDKGVVYKICDSSGLIFATVRSHWVPSREALERSMGCECQLPDSCFPTLFFSRGATVGWAMRAGLHSLMRYHYLRAAAALGAASATGAVYEHAPRVRSMAELGYVFECPSRVWDPEVRAINRMLVAYLPAAGLASALNTLAAMHEHALAQYPIDFDVIAAHAALRPQEAANAP